MDKTLSGSEFVAHLLVAPPLPIVPFPTLYWAAASRS
jgi:hypothetical protein